MTANTQRQERIIEEIEREWHPDAQFLAGQRIAANIGYRLVEEPPHPDCPHERSKSSAQQDGGAGE